MSGEIHNLGLQSSTTDFSTLAKKELALLEKEFSSVADLVREPLNGLRILTIEAERNQKLFQEVKDKTAEMQQLCSDLKVENPKLKKSLENLNAEYSKIQNTLTSMKDPFNKLIKEVKICGTNALLLKKLQEIRENIPTTYDIRYGTFEKKSATILKNTKQARELIDILEENGASKEYIDMYRECVSDIEKEISDMKRLLYTQTYFSI